ncbi:major facilitator superfamily domain-containing protein [Ganoderma leucocontextum]|nr:major facilitator superfamily domain-containing protein [Ganoderma leucocontextum]
MRGTPVTHASKADMKSSVEVVETEKALPSTQQSAVFVVGFEEAGTNDPRKWPRWFKKWISALVTIVIGMMTSASTVQQSFGEEFQAEFGFNFTVTQLLVGRSMIWLCIGPLLWGALSDKYGRKPTLVLSFLLFITFQIGATLSRDAVSLLFFKILAGLSGSASPPICAAILSDIWDHPSRDRAITFTIITLVLPQSTGALGSIFGKTGWRGPSWVFTIAASVFLFLATFTLRETHRPKILREYAKRMRLKTQDGRYLAPSEVFQHEAWPQCICQVLTRPFGLLREPLLMGSSIYLMLLMACLQIAYTAFPYAFQTYPHSAGPALLVGSGNFSIIAGQVVAFLLVSEDILSPAIHADQHMPQFAFAIHPYVYPRWGRVYAPDRSPPETRLTLAIWASVLLTVSFLWSGGTLTPSINGWVPIVGGLMMGVASVLIVLVMFNYVMDLYENIAGSALAWCIVAMYIFQSFFPLFSDRMMQVLTPRWAMLVGGAGALLTIPFPWLLKRYGRMLRECSRYIQ